MVFVEHPGGLRVYNNPPGQPLDVAGLADYWKASRIVQLFNRDDHESAMKARRTGGVFTIAEDGTVTATGTYAASAGSWRSEQLYPVSQR